MNDIRSEIFVELETRQNLEADILTRLDILAEVESRQELTADILSRHEIEAVVETRAVDDGYYASVRDEALHLLKNINVDGNELVLNG